MDPASGSSVSVPILGIRVEKQTIKGNTAFSYSLWVRHAGVPLALADLNAVKLSPLRLWLLLCRLMCRLLSEVPPDSLVYSDGSPVTGPVTVGALENSGLAGERPVFEACFCISLMRHDSLAPNGGLDRSSDVKYFSAAVGLLLVIALAFSHRHVSPDL